MGLTMIIYEIFIFFYVGISGCYILHQLI